VPGDRVRSLLSGGRVVGELGPSWVWPPWQPAVATWLPRLGVHTAAQHDVGDGLFERDAGLPVERAFLPAQNGIRRVVGGPGALVDALVSRLPTDTVIPSSAVVGFRARHASSTP